MIRLTATVHGLVQGVSFRYYTEREAQKLGLTGWVANHPDRTVRVVAEGSETAVTQFVEFLHRGSPSARVNKVDSQYLPATGEFSNFRVRWL